MQNTISRETKVMDIQIKYSHENIRYAFMDFLFYHVRHKQECNLHTAKKQRTESLECTNIQRTRVFCYALNYTTMIPLKKKRKNYTTMLIYTATEYRCTAMDTPS